MGEQSIAQKTLGEDADGSGGEGAMAATAVKLFQLIAEDFLTDRVHIYNGSGFTVFVI
jgi:hypothetical protein